MNSREDLELLFEERDVLNGERLSLMNRNCMTVSRDPKEVLRDVEIALCVSIKKLSVEEFEKVFEVACPAAKTLVDGELNYSGKRNLERKDFLSSLEAVLKVTYSFQKAFEYLNEFSNIRVRQIKSLLTATCEVLFSCFSHCKRSEEVYGTLFESLTEGLSDFFKKCCSLLDQFLHVLTEKVECNVEVDAEVFLMGEMLNFLSKSGDLLLSLEVKTSAKVWKCFAFLSEKYACFVKNTHIGDTIRTLCAYITSNMEALSSNFQKFSKLIKLNCFLLKLVIKCCEVFKGCLQNCQNSLLNLLLMLCRYNITHCETEVISYQDAVGQLTIETNPLLLQLMTDGGFVTECMAVCKDLQKSVEFSILCCLILKNLSGDATTTRSLWFSENVNILEWIFLSASSSEFVTCSNISLPCILINGKQKKFTDLYEYVLVTMSAFSLTATAEEYCLIERTLIVNVLQTNPIRALLAIDIWCLLARFGSVELCFAQIQALGKILQQFETPRIEKCYLASLVQRLFSLLPGNHRKLFLQSFEAGFHSFLLKGHTMDCLTANEVRDICLALLAKVEHLLPQDALKTSNEGSSAAGKISKLWKFDCDILSSTCQSVKFLEIVCTLTASVVSDLPPEKLLMVLTKVKRLLEVCQQTCVRLFFLRIIKSLSTVRVPPGNFQKKIITTIAEVFQKLLSSKEVLVKGKAFEIFYSFSHVTPHEEVITLCVLNAPELKLEIKDYFSRKPPDRVDFSLDQYVRELQGSKLGHVCRENESEMSKKVKFGHGGDVDETLTRWKRDGKRIFELFQSLSQFQKREVKALCDSILSLPS